jgi:uncharacterized protein (TIGR02594 family)
MDEYYRVTAYALNVRDAPSLNGNIIGHLVMDQVVKKLAISTDKYWLQMQTVDNLVGWASLKYLVPNKNDAEILPEDYPWMKIAIPEIGAKEWADPGENPRILEYLRSTDLGSPLTSSDETDWCSAFVNWCMEKAEYEGTSSARARSWLNWGKAIAIPVRGCIVVFRRDCPNGNPNICGHVGFFLGETATQIKLLGGNQDNAVNVRNYAKSRLLGYRLPGP